MSGNTPNRCKKNGKKNKTPNSPEVIQVKSVKLNTKNLYKNGKPLAKSEDNLRTTAVHHHQKKSSSMKKESENDSNNGDITETESSIVKKIRTLSLKHDDSNNCGASTSQIGALVNSSTRNGSVQEVEPREEHKMRQSDSHSKLDNDRLLDVASSMDCNDDSYDMSAMGDEYASYNYSKYYPKSSKSIRFINQVTVLYFNGEEVLCESMEPLKKEIEQQERNKEMRKEHLMTKGHEIDNLYLF